MLFRSIDQIDIGSVGDQLGVDVSGIDGGGFVLTWSSKSDVNAVTAEIQGQRYDADGNTVGAAFLVATNVDSNAADARSLGTSDGGFMVVWKNASDGATTGRHFLADGSAAGAAFNISNGSAVAGLTPALAEVADGRVVVTWAGDDIYRQVIDFDGHPDLVAAPTLETTQQRFIMPDGLINLHYVGTSEPYLPTGLGGDVDNGGFYSDDRPWIDASAKWGLHFHQDGRETVPPVSEAYITGNAADNRITGNSGGDVLDGGAGLDTLIGGLGDDTYLLGDSTDVVIENANEGRDILWVKVASFSLAAQPNIEGLVFATEAGIAVTGTGNALDNLMGTNEDNGGDNTFDGAAGNDFIASGSVVWLDCVLLSAGTIAGGFIGPVVGRRLGQRFVRGFITAAGFALGIYFLIHR